MASFDWDGGSGVTTGATRVDVVAAPGSGKRRVKGVTVTNVDTATATVTFYYNDNGAIRQIGEPLTLAVNEAAQLPEGHVLDSTQSIQVSLGAAVATNELDFTSSWGDYTA